MKRQSTCSFNSLLQIVVLATLLTGCLPISDNHHFLPPRTGKLYPSVKPKGNTDWPIKFQAHYFGAHCFDTKECEIRYRGFPHGNEDTPSPSIASYGRPLQDLLSAGRGPIPNFPPPAEVTWRSLDGSSHETKIDIGEIFKDQLIRHTLKRQEISDRGIGPGAVPSIILEVNDRTINVYIRAHISTKELQNPRINTVTLERI